MREHAHCLSVHALARTLSRCLDIPRETRGNIHEVIDLAQTRNLDVVSPKRCRHPNKAETAEEQTQVRVCKRNLHLVYTISRINSDFKHIVTFVIQIIIVKLSMFLW